MVKLPSRIQSQEQKGVNIKASNNSQKLDPETWVEEYGDSLYYFALSRVLDSSIAEDLVQETFLGALTAKKSFESRSSEKTWLTGILKHKIIDHFRKQQKEQPYDDMESLKDATDDLFDEKGKWKIKPVKWPKDVHHLYEQQEFMQILRQCLSTLSPKAANVFVLREMDGESTDDICKILNVSATNCWVLLHRARMFLRRCLEKNWFMEEV